MKVALVYDRVNKFGGAERVLQVLHEIYPDAPLYTAVYNKETAPWGDDFEIRTTFLQNIPFAKTNHEYFAPLIPLAFESLDFSEYDLVISVTSEYAKGIITKPGIVHICYCLTPTRYLWSGYEEYFGDSWFQGVAKPSISYLRTWDKVAAQRPDYYMAISQTVSDRIKKYYGRESEVIYPPVGLASSNQRPASSSKNIKTKRYTLDASGFFLIVSRLVAYKRIDIAISACNKLGLPLKIAGTGRQLKKLKSIAGPTIEFLGNLTDEALSRYYQDCSALLFPGVEDFGLGMVEAQSFGKPVIAFKSGGAEEIVIDGKTGILFAPQKSKALIDVLKQFDREKYDPEDCRKNAHRFSKEHFKKEFTSAISKLVSS